MSKFFNPHHKIQYFLVPLAFSLITPFVGANEPIYIAESDAMVPAVEQPKSEEVQNETVQNENVQNEQENLQENSQAQTSEQNAQVREETALEKRLKALDDSAPVFSDNEKTSDEVKVVKEKKKHKKDKTEENYSDYLIKEDGYLPVGDVSDKQISIQGSISKTEQLSLSDCLDIALRNNPKIKAAYAQSASIKENKVQTAANYSPTISTKTGITRIKPDTTGSPYSISPYTKYLLGNISISQLVYDFGVTQNAYTINKLEWEASKQNIDETVNSVVRDVKDAYYNLLYAISAKLVREEAVQQFELMYNQAQAFYEIGTHPKVDVTIASANLAEARANYIEASNAVDLAVSKLNNIMGTPFIEPYVVDTSIPYQETDITMRSAVEIANKARPDLKIAITQVEMANQAVKLSKKAYAPSLSFAADLGMGGKNDFSDKNWYNIGGYLSFPVINPVSMTSQYKQAKANLEQQKHSTTSVVNDIYYEIQTAYVKLTDARQRISASKVAVQEARESFELSQGRYKAGVCDAIELKEAQLTYENAKLAYISNIYAYNSAKASLEKAIGQSLQPVNLEENVEI